MVSFAAAQPIPRARRTFEWQALLCSCLLALIGFSILYPIALVILQSFDVADPGQARQWGLLGWQAALSEPLLRSSLINTIVLTVLKQAITLPVAIGIAWLLARSDLPGRNLLQFGFWIAF